MAFVNYISLLSSSLLLKTFDEKLSESSSRGNTYDYTGAALAAWGFDFCMSNGLFICFRNTVCNFYNLCLQCASGELKGKLSFTNNASIGVYLVPKMYPKKEYDSYDIYINEDKINTNNVIFANVEDFQ